MNTTYTEIRVRHIPALFIAGELFDESHWLAELIEGGTMVWADVYAVSHASADDARRQLLDILDGKSSVL